MKLSDTIRTLLFQKKNTTSHQLFTKWGEELNPNRLLTEYPRPQLRRGNYEILNGYWDYAITNTEEKNPVFEGKIVVPFSPESVLSGVERQLQPEEFLWYQKCIQISEKIESSRLILHFGAVDQQCEIFVENVKVGEHIGGYLPFSIDMTEYIQLGKNLLRIKVRDESEYSYHSRGKQKLKNGGMFYTAQSGIWQTVWMEWVPKRYITFLVITPLTDTSAVRIRLCLSETNSDQEQLPLNTIEIYENDRCISKTDTRDLEITIPLETFIYWSPENPFLYTVIVNSGEDRVESYFGMRKIEIKQEENQQTSTSKKMARIYLNGQPYFQNGLLDQGYWPDGLYTAPSDEALIFDILKAKELGYNMLRKHIKVESLRFYYHCDRIGMLVWQDMVNGGDKENLWIVSYLPTALPMMQSFFSDKKYSLFGRSSAEGRKEWITECEETVRLLYNSPSIVTWVPFNEGWGQFDAGEIYQRIRKLDSTRLIDHASGWYDQGCGDFTSVHNYFRTLKVLSNSRPFILSEFGGEAYYIKEHSYSSQIYGYRIHPSKESLNKAFTEKMNQEIPSLIEQGLCASVYTQLTDVEDEVNGLLTYDRKICKVTPVHTLK